MVVFIFGMWYTLGEVVFTVRKLAEFLTRNKKYIIYFFVGVLTTVINYTVYLLSYNICNYSAAVSNIAAWLVAIFFSFFVNKFFVFTSHRCSTKILAAELVKFVGCRIVSGGLETAIVFVAADILNLNGLIWKIFSSIFVIIFNYICSDFFVFRNKA